MSVPVRPHALRVARARLVLVGLLALALGMLPAAPSASAATATNNPAFTANVMAPLWVDASQWPTFESQIRTAREYGVDAVSVDVWWGKVETTDQVFDWSYYDTMFAKIKAQGLKIVPILSFHQCGGNVGDTCSFPLPTWVWSKYTGRTLNGVTLDGNGLRYRSEQGNLSSETLQVWADPLVVGEYADFATAFKNRYGTTYANDLQELNVSLGPAGELRYPSYNAHDSGTGYPTRGALQSYSPLAVASFRSAMLTKYGTLASVNTAWGTSLTSTSQITPPSDGTGFFTSNSYRAVKYGKDFVDWYNQSLVTHGKTVLDAVSGALGSSFGNAPLGYKVPGVHWAMTNPSYPRAAEVAAGLVQTSVDMDAAATGHGYTKVVGLAKQVATTRQVVLHFTCLEMTNTYSSPAWSGAQDLVFWVAQHAQSLGVTIKGENALSGGVATNAGWDTIVNAFDYAPYTGLTVLRVGDVSSGLGMSRYAAFIARYRQRVTVHYAEPASATGYTMHPWNGLTGDRAMTYEGYLNGRHWWSTTVQGTPTFNFAFVSSGGAWDGATRWYPASSTHVYVLPGSTDVAITRP
ncbi:family 14 glycosylhydrolase [Arthrobacter sp. NEB 688]|uniref:family 14 glycosylhydrolase n=1 Tax=Arthrobacter sp. NEB 688 TaxID=904039 RepID=UPI001567C378|nr:family 14 glycosylhydrolase [Arthrobacter sp. NEB 688]QKE84418.1 family 14 glycosylhydrolase [Arthrobacter sp. NEB 688]